MPNKVVLVALISLLLLSSIVPLTLVAENATAVRDLEADVSFPSIVPIYPALNSTLTAPPTYVQFQVLLPENTTVQDLSCSIEGFSYELVAIGGDQYQMDIPDSHWNWSADVHENFEQMYGTNMVFVSLGTNNETVGYQQTTSAWDFYLLVEPPQMELAIHQYYDGYELLAPSAWTVYENQSVGTTFFDLGFEGPSLSPGTAIGDVVTKATVQSGTDSSIVESEVYLDSIIDAIITGLQGQGYAVSLSDGPNYVTISGHAGAIFDLTWPDSPGVKQRIGMVVDGEEDQYYIITCSVAKPFFDAYSPSFQQMILSLELLSAEPISFTSFQYQDLYRLDLPTGWPVVEDQNIGGERVDLVASGPQYQGFTTNINFVSGTEEGVSGDIDYLWDQVNQTIADLEGSGHTVVLENAPTFVDIDGRPAVLFTLDWQSDLAIKQRMGIIVDEALEKMYVITCTVHESRYDQYSSDFETVVQSITVLEGPSEDEPSTDSTWLYFIAGIGAVAAVAVGLMLFLRTRKK